MDEPGPSSAFYASFPSTSTGPVRPPSPSQNASEEPELDLTYYTLLNLPRSASESQIRDRYRSLASTYHPDRQRSDSTRSAAHANFTQIQRAYEVLIDPRQRIIYDHFGEEGLTTSWEVGLRNRTPEELKRHFVNVTYANKVTEAEALVKPRSNISVVVDVRAALARKSMWKHPEGMKHDPISRLRRIGLGRVNMQHSFEMPVDLGFGKGKSGTAPNKGKGNTQFVVGGNMVAWNGQGGGNVTGTVKHQFSNWVWGEVGTSLLGPRVVTAKGTVNVDENT
jgi:DnaJ family protein C protein 11